ncbi:MAG: flagellar export chaperone FlgN [Ignavibacteria bacterium]|nr:flagellar export chaperone FlgN [Ignavibacteria bacterium]MDP3580355.1 flagellar export chaperone FlgN [Ignavibacteria bacterium]
MSTKLLLASLKTQEINLSLLIDALDLQKQAIIKNDYTTLESAIGKEQKILHDVQREETARIKVVKELANSLNLNLSENTLENLINQGSKHFGNDLKELHAIRSSLRDKVNRIKSTNTQLKDVIDFSRNMIKETMMLLVGSTKHAIVNKRV